jgi:hypothetical protein
MESFMFLNIMPEAVPWILSESAKCMSDIFKVIYFILWGREQEEGWGWKATFAPPLCP